MAEGNRETRAAITFHNATKYMVVGDVASDDTLVVGSPPDPDSAGYSVDWALLPLMYKIYETLAPLSLPAGSPPSALPGLEAIARTGAEPAGEAIPDREMVASIARLSNGLLGRPVRYWGGQTIEFRTVGSTGALYHLEVYFACADLPDLAAGLYHYAAHDHSLRQLRAGDVRQALVAASGDEPALAEAPVILALTSTFWRNAWFYRSRAYRHTYWDGGMALCHVLAVAAGHALPARLVLGYADAAVNAVLGVDGVREATVALCALGRTTRPLPTAASLPPLDYPTRSLSPREVTFRVIPTMHQASALDSGAAARAWRAATLRGRAPDPQGPLIPLQPLPADHLPEVPIEELILRRRSTRRYDRETPISFAAFSTLLERSSRGVAADCLAPDALPLHDLYLIVNNVAGLAAGVYLHHPQRHAVELLREGEFRAQAQRLSVGQEAPRDAHVNCYYLADLEAILECYGNRGYRLAQLGCSLSAGKLHLGAHALGLGAVGSTALDDEVIAFFSPHAAGKSYMFVNVFGKPRARQA
jgi:SagB-type dehydrogenase family enzyme